jgi:hypothetical protein
MGEKLKVAWDVCYSALFTNLVGWISALLASPLSDVILAQLACPLSIDIKRRKNRLLKFCYVPATSAAHNRLLFFLFLLRPFTVLMKQTRQAVRSVKQSIFLDVYALE